MTHGWPAVLALSIVAGCAPVGPEYSRPDIGVPDAWQRAGESRAAYPGREDLSAWWQRLQDPALSRLIEDSLTASVDLRRAQARLRQARALRAAAGAERFPTVSA